MEYFENYKIIKANSFFPPLDSTETYFLFTFKNQQDSILLDSLINKFVNNINNKHNIQLKYYYCNYISPGRNFFRPLDIPILIKEKPLLIMCACRNLTREKREIWKYHRTEWDKNINYLTGLHDYSFAVSFAEDTIPFEYNIISGFERYTDSIQKIITGRIVFENKVIIIIGSDLAEKMKFI